MFELLLGDSTTLSGIVQCRQIVKASAVHITTCAGV